MEEKRNEELKEIWESLKLLGTEIDEKNLEKVLSNYDEYKAEVMMMAKLRYIGKLRNKYPDIYNFMQKDAEDVIEMIKDVLTIEQKKEKMSLPDYVVLFSEKIEKLNEQGEEKMKIYEPKEIGED